jgi:predicted DCC family thiol-disulfide oxidoreductase YuxK
MTADKERVTVQTADLQHLEGLVLIDGVCVLCSASFRFVARRDRDRRFRFAPIQGSLGRRVAAAIGIDADQPDSFAVITDGRPLFKSQGAIFILRNLPGWRWSAVLLAVPRPLRDWIYDRVARNRYTVFGRMDVCMVPTAEFRAHMHDEAA